MPATSPLTYSTWRRCFLTQRPERRSSLSGMLIFRGMWKVGSPITRTHLSSTTTSMTFPATLASSWNLLYGHRPPPPWPMTPSGTKRIRMYRPRLAQFPTASAAKMGTISTRALQRLALSQGLHSTRFSSDGMTRQRRDGQAGIRLGLMVGIGICIGTFIIIRSSWQIQVA